MGERWEVIAAVSYVSSVKLADKFFLSSKELSVGIIIDHLRACGKRVQVYKLLTRVVNFSYGATST